MEGMDPIRIPSITDMEKACRALVSISMFLDTLNGKFERFLRIEEEKYPAKPLVFDNLCCVACFKKVRATPSISVDYWHRCDHGYRCPACGPCEECTEQGTVDESLSDA